MCDLDNAIKNSELLTDEDRVFLIYLQKIIDNLNDMEYWLDKYNLLPPKKG
jgi:hypothetical protein